MKFTTPILLAALISLVSADGIFSITSNATDPSSTTSPTIYLQVLNDLTTDPPKCAGSVTTSPLPTSGTIPCVEGGYGLTFTWTSIREGIAATYTSPGNTFTYNVPNLGCDGTTCQFGFTDLFPGKKARGFEA